MFQLSDVIEDFNRRNGTKISLNKNWGLFYLQPDGLALLNKNADWLRDSVDYAPPFTINNKEQNKTSAETKSQPVKKEISALRDGIRKINIQQAISHRLSWEGNFFATLSNDQVWLDVEEDINRKKESVKKYFRQVRQNWNIHRPFQRHSSKGLLFLLNLIVDYQHHFSQAYEELQRKKQTWMPFVRLPTFIAESYEQFLVKELNKFTLLRKKVLAALLLRLKTIEQQGLVTCDDVSYTLALQGEWLNLIKFKLPALRTALDTNTFNRMQRAIETHGEERHRSQLYQLAWLQYENVCNSDEFTIITMSGSRLLAPNALLAFMSRNNKKWFWFWFWFSSDNTITLQFLEKQQALLVQLFLQPVRDPIILNPISTCYPELLTLSAQYQLLQQSRCSLKQQRLYWWQWEKKFWKRTWQKWLGQQLERKQASLLNKLNETFEEVKEYHFELQNVMFHEQVQVILKTIQALMSESVSKGEKASLSNMFKYIDENSRVKREDSVEQVQGSTKASPQTRQSTSKKNGWVLSVLQPKFLAGNNRPISIEKNPEINELTRLKPY